jgi:hypothetical protein
MIKMVIESPRRYFMRKIFFLICALALLFTVSCSTTDMGYARDALQQVDNGFREQGVY